ncbi:hypothetical protein HYH03_003535 [Edaphochlamys debaryana]|uniref:Uncharacterized protein n=1 Tax=Edaphochlamys debaryana TaxID=47281 RepID=A0A835YII3_9CHLO|nr:hypothetical protein HYH03_003535 [Edaphochlamys debaryana]|eukprot:KAG2498274.1 hypothetical protein HYH03_003535 [Edaphochlamys debaryana]
MTATEMVGCRGRWRLDLVCEDSSARWALLTSEGCVERSGQLSPALCRERWSTCLRPRNWCVGTSTVSATYRGDVDCDADGFKDHTCTFSNGTRSVIYTSKDCTEASALGLPSSSCPALGWKNRLGEILTVFGGYWPGASADGWTPWRYCMDSNGYTEVQGYSYRYERYVATEDDNTALNGIDLLCKGGSKGRVTDGFWGLWYPGATASPSVWLNCGAGKRITSVRLKYMRASVLNYGTTKGDDLAAIAVEMRCDGGATAGLESYDTRWSTEGPSTGRWSGTLATRGDGTQTTAFVWTPWVTCGTGGFVCGMQARVEPNLGDGPDDTTLNGVKIQCCYWN